MDAKRILVVDDDPDVGATLAAAAEDSGYEAGLAANREEFIAQYRAKLPSVIAIDLMMPDSDGIELLRFLAEHRSPSKIIVISGADARVLATTERLGVSYGLAMLGTLQKPISIPDFEAILRKARSRTPEITEDELRQAIQTDALTLHYQPKANLRSKRTWDIVGYEALVRWHHPQHGLLMPDTFIPIAERTGLIGKLTTFVIDAAVRQLRQWHDQGQGLTVSMNLAPHLLNDIELPDRISRIVTEYGVPPDCMVLEITESGAMADAALTMDILARCRLKGFGLSLDDFGTGYSSLVQLHRMPFNELKIDKSFVMEVGRDEEAVKIIKSIASLARSLGMSLCAEGIESAEAVRLLRSLDCDTGQGFLIGRPVPGEQVRLPAEDNRTSESGRGGGVPHATKSPNTAR